MKQFRNLWLMIGLLFSLTLVLSSCDDDDDDGTIAPVDEVAFENIALTGEAEVQDQPVVTDGSGTLHVFYNMETNVIRYNVTWQLGNDADVTTGMHFHGPATTSESAEIVIGIPISGSTSGYDEDEPNKGAISGQTRPLTQQEEEQFLSGLWYLNIHSTTYPDGELRGQVD
ncbi:CHRD domain-containing protein [Pontibacter anaerobius]|uniref:CHRD domain-containing protein n=1 Tax=Pontibacter anaerobius TaxID=2993940 RepID=A0ABT3RDB8_9BACT|nr:CHRD domain-containing protein [Pontibacter anaerobius]MCX2739841.1 CHRD domain-containing protein [Pontibacter anaerobius]